MSAELNELKCREEEWDFQILSNRLLMKRTDRPDEWAMDSLASMALELEDRADTISSRIQEVNDALIVAEDRVKELEDKLSMVSRIANVLPKDKAILWAIEGTGK